jgi:hypothetical protein
MNQKYTAQQYRRVIILLAFALFAFTLLVALLSPGAISLVVALPALIELLRISLKAVEGS